jgi:hypothetical protein
MNGIEQVTGSERWVTASQQPCAASGESGNIEAGESRFGHVLQAIGSEVDCGERLMQAVVAGVRPLDAASLIALQAGIYRWGEAVDLASKLVDRAGSAVRTTLQNGNG